MEINISNLKKDSVLKVISIINKCNLPINVIELQNTARSAKDAANSLKVPVGAIVKTLVFEIMSQNNQLPIITLVAGDKKCNIDKVPKILKLNGNIIKPDANKVKEITGYSIGGVSPIGLPKGIHIIMDLSLKRFDKIWSAAGHSHCVFSSSFDQLVKIINPVLSDELT